MGIIEQMATIALAAVTNFITRWLPFHLFTQRKTKQGEVAPFIKGLGEFLPPAIMTMLVVYCYRNVNLTNLSANLPELLAGLITVAVHLWQRKMFLSLALGTLSYILLVNFVF
ncbi:branched-chain amino acid transporter permease [Limosilactobacillus antri]|uniref:branched-chain amino acid transporter permease n=1 Tax=Limosilactobacillus antri TaxID=227943 RepID=UPI001F55CF48|nr:AzlD domain-containing protein [Limosilactobacillus antri]